MPKHTLKIFKYVWPFYNIMLEMVNLRSIVQNENIVVIKDDKDSVTAIMKKLDHVAKLCTRINGGIIKGIYIETTEKMLKELSR